MDSRPRLRSHDTRSRPPKRHNRRRISGATVLIHENGRLHTRLAYGGVTPDTRLWLASLTKPVTNAAALILTARGALDLDAPIARFLPELADRRVLTNDGPAATFQPTVRDLMRHTSGFVHGDLGDTPVHRLYRAANLYDPALDRAGFLARLSPLPLAHTPGTTFEYGISTDVLGAIVETVSGQSLPAFVAAEISRSPAAGA